ncbi:SidA/IucD/PvdA family monooxygenase [Kribbella sp. NPDC056861]|uniref:lysine N(6)-hydroxylase/L-ornithine N(5)-oxygenase family protein n=1 Tax=Kribbella sp. NPDC056861 TaxID=3154857 RepID=UPI00341A9EBC
MGLAAQAGNPVYDVIGVGFGPSNLALAIAAGERGAASPRALFLERQAGFGWHRGMLIEDATMQVSFLKDLVTLRNPASEFSFLSFLHQNGRLIDFINHKTLFPLRIEFHDYLEWAADKVSDVVRYDREVQSVRPLRTDGVIDAFEVTSTGQGGTSIDVTRNMVLGVGLTPHLPAGISRSDRVWHNQELLTRVRELDGRTPGRFVVVGAGQSAAEVTAYLHETFPQSEVCAVFSRYGYSPADDSPFANRVFDPGAVDEFYSSPEDVKQMVLDYHGNTNYSVVDGELIEALYSRQYRERVLGIQRLRTFNVSRVVDLVESDQETTVTIESLSTGQKTELPADVVVYCTGYRPADPVSLLGDIGELCRRDQEGRIKVGRDYRVQTTGELQAGIYLQGGGTEHTHGLASSLLSNTAIRAGEIVESIAAAKVAQVADIDRPHAVPDVVGLH